MSETSIQWTDHSINPIRARLRDDAHAALVKGGYGSGVGHYCEKISPGCAHCYSSTSQKRFGMPDFPGVQKGEPAVEVFFDHSRLQEVLRRHKPTKYFWCDQTDLFGKWVPFDWIDKCFAVMALTPWHTHQILTKRVERMAEYLSDDRTKNRVAGACGEVDPGGKLRGGNGRTPWPLPNAWLGTSVEDQPRADERIPLLLRCPAAVRFLSCEPLLSEINLTEIRDADGTHFMPLTGIESDEPRIHWLIAGGESGPGARPCNVEWIRSLVNQCKAAGVACFVKQLGSNPDGGLTRCPNCGDVDTDECRDVMGADDGNLFCNQCNTEFDASAPFKLSDPKGGSMKDFPSDLAIRQFPSPAMEQVR